METLFERSKRKVMVTAHGGYTIARATYNSMLAFEAAVCAGADIIEADFCLSGEGKPYIFHPGTEKVLLYKDISIPTMTNAEIDALRYPSSGQHIATADELFETFKGRCYINTDKAYGCFPELVKTIRRHNIMDQIILKGEVRNPEVYDMTEELAPDIPFLAVSYEEDTALEMCKGRNINYVGSEVVFAKDDAPVAQDEYIEKMHKNGKVIWVNPIIFNFSRPLAGGHDDYRSATGDPDGGWGWLADKGYDILQTDWVGDVINYLKNSNKLYRS